MSREQTHRVVVVGGGFGGLQAVRKLRRAPVDVTVVDRQNYTLFQPLVYQVATGALSPAEIAAPLRVVFRRQRNVRVLLGEVTAFDLERREIVLDHLPNGEKDVKLGYDTLIVAGGSRYSYFGAAPTPAPDLGSTRGHAGSSHATPRRPTAFCRPRRSTSLPSTRLGASAPMIASCASSWSAQCGFFCPLRLPIGRPQSSLRGYRRRCCWVDEADVLRDEGEAYAARPPLAGVHITTVRNDGITDGAAACAPSARTGSP
jgi:hypothetical protein